MALTRDAIREADDLETREVEVPSWGGSVYVRTLTAKERDQWESSILTVESGPDGKMTQQLNQENVRARLVARCTVDENGERLFSDEDAEWLGNKSSRPLSRIFDVAQELNGIGEEDVEELAKNSNSAPNGDSPSA